MVAHVRCHRRRRQKKRERSVWSEMGSMLKLSRFSRSQFVFFSGVVRGGLDGHTGLKLVCTWQVSSSFSAYITSHYLTLPHIASLSFARSAQYSCYSVNSGVHVATVCIILRELNGLHVIIHRWYKKITVIINLFNIYCLKLEFFFFFFFCECWMIL